MHVDIALVVPVRDGRVLVARRAEDAHQGGTWEFPGGKVEPGEEPLAAARRELHEECGLTADGLEPLAVFFHEYPDRALRFHVFIARDPAGDVSIDGGRESSWCTFAELQRLEMPEANASILGALRWRLA